MFFLKKISSKERMQFLRQLSVMLEAGVPLDKALNIVLEEKLSKPMREELIKLTVLIKEGRSLSLSLSQSKLGDGISDIIGVGEEDGKLAEAIGNALKLLEKLNETKKKILSSISYPCFVLMLSFACIILLVVVILPLFSSIFSELGVPLPLLSRAILAFSFFISYFWPALLVLVLLSFILLNHYSKKERGKLILDQLKLRIPVVGPILKKLILSRTFLALGSLLSSGVHLTRALQSASASSGNEVYKKLYLKVLRDIESGEKLSASLFKSKVFPEGALQLICAGEESGALSQMLICLSRSYEDEVEHQLKFALSLIEPISTILVGGIVSIIVFGIFLPLINLIGSFQQ